eukprot:scaffold56629_cov45-Prasinocladus_malaysianus.AAC.4
MDSLDLPSYAHSFLFAPEAHSCRHYCYHSSFIILSFMAVAIAVATIIITISADRWREDPRWRGFLGGSDKRIPSYKAKYPSRWLPVWGDKDIKGQRGPEIRVVDHLLVKKKTARMA